MSFKFENNTYKLLARVKYNLEIETDIDIKEIFLVIDATKFKFGKSDTGYLINIPITSMLGNKRIFIEFILDNDEVVRTSFVAFYTSMGKVVNHERQLLNDYKIKLYYKDSKGTWKIYNDRTNQFPNPYVSSDGYYGFVLPKGEYRMKISKRGYETKYVESINFVESANILNKTIQLNNFSSLSLLLLLRNEFDINPLILVPAILLLLLLLIVTILRLLFIVLKGEINGVIYDYNTRQPVEGVSLKLVKSNKTCNTDSFGRFKFKNVNLLRADLVILDDVRYVGVERDIVVGHIDHLYNLGDRIKSINTKKDLTCFVIKNFESPS